MFVSTDLHGHTYFSDGRATPEEFISFRRALGMRVVAISDHDVMAAVRRGARVAHAYGMTLVPAMETTSFINFGTDKAEQVHVLAYYPPSFLVENRLEQTFLYQRGLKVQQKWREFVLAWLDALPVEDREAIDPGRKLAALGPDRFPALQSFIDLVVARKRELFDPFRKHHVRFWTEDAELFGWEPEQLCDAIRADGAVDVVAHAVRYKDHARMERVLQYVSGIEVYTSRHNAEAAARFREYAEKHGKLWTASSDDHQNARYIQPPSGTPVATLERILQMPVPREWLADA
ncbi:MAG: PHP domain-containing protein [Myxococcota bacterium]